AGRVARDEGRFSTAGRRLRRARQLAEKHAAADLLASVLISEAELLGISGRAAAARRSLDRAASIITRERKVLQAQLECAQGMLQRWENHPAAACRILDRVLERCE